MIQTDNSPLFRIWIDLELPPYGADEFTPFRATLFHQSGPKPGIQVGYIDATGRTVVPPQFDDAGDFSEGLAPARAGGL
jgi:WG containing repeat